VFPPLERIMPRFKGKGRGKGQSNRRTSDIVPSDSDSEDDAALKRTALAHYSELKQTTRQSELRASANSHGSSGGGQQPLHSMDDLAWTRVKTEDEVLPNVISTDEEDDMDETSPDEDTEEDYDDTEDDEESEGVLEVVYEKITVKRRKAKKKSRQSHGVAYYVQSLAAGKEGNDDDDDEEAETSSRDILYDREEYSVRAVRRDLVSCSTSRNKSSQEPSSSDARMAGKKKKKCHLPRQQEEQLNSARKVFKKKDDLSFWQNSFFTANIVTNNVVVYNFLHRRKMSQFEVKALIDIVFFLGRFYQPKLSDGRNICW